jgi:hypothetical protein
MAVGRDADGDASDDHRAQRWGDTDRDQAGGPAGFPDWRAAQGPKRQWRPQK